MHNILLPKVDIIETKIHRKTGLVNKLQHDTDKQNLEKKIEYVDRKMQDNIDLVK